MKGNPLKIIENSMISQLLKEYREVIGKDEIKDFNVFTITSDLYYRENYHSDILAAFLDHKDEETGKYVLLDAFIEILKELTHESSEIEFREFVEPETLRESNHIDILIKDRKSNHCIIVENKINNAPDMPRQLPRYYEAMQAIKCEVDAIVYLTLIPDVMPDCNEWKPEDVSAVKKRIIALSVANEKGKISLLSNWVKPSLEKVMNQDINSVLGQYQKLLETLSNSVKKDSYTKLLLKELQKSYGEKIALTDIYALREMLNNLPIAMANDLRSDLADYLKEKDASLRTSKWQPNSCIINLGGENTIYVYCELNEKCSYRVGVADFSKQNKFPEWLQGKLVELTSEKYYPKKNSEDEQVTFEFGFYEKWKLIRLIDKLIQLYKSYY